MSNKRKHKQKARRRLGFVPQATGKVSRGHGMGFNISTRSHEVHKDKRKEARKRACRGRIREEG